MESRPSKPPLQPSPPPPLRQSLPQNKTFQKRPLPHPPLPPPTSAQQKYVYISSRTPFVAALKRVTFLLSTPGPGSGSTKLRAPKRSGKKTSQGGSGKGEARKDGRDAGGEGKGKGDGEKEAKGVVIKATGKAIERALSVSLELQRQEFRIQVRTGTVRTVDDIVEDEGNTRKKRKRRKNRDGEDKEEEADVEMQEGGEEKEMGREEEVKEEDEVEMLPRNVSVVEIHVRKPNGGTR